MDQSKKNEMVSIYKQVTEAFEKMILITEKIYESLKNKDIDSLKILNKEQSEMGSLLQKKLELMGNKHQEYGYLLNEKNLTNLTMEEKEDLNEYRSNMIRLSNEMQKNAFVNQELSRVLIQCGETTIDAFIQYAQEEMDGKSLFIEESI